MSKLVLLGGPVGVGKSSAMRNLKSRITRVGLVDADEVWQVSDDLTPDENRSYAHDNVNAVIAGYARAGVETCVVNWVFARAELYEPIIAASKDLFDDIVQLYLVANPDVLEERIKHRWMAQGQDYDLESLVDYSKSRLALIHELPYDKIDTSLLSAEEVADQIALYLSK